MVIQKTLETHSTKMYHVFKNTSQYLLISDIIKYHHIEQFPKSMYDQIPIEAKILSIADKIDTHYMDLNSYKAACNKVMYIARPYFDKTLLETAKKAIDRIETKIRVKHSILLSELKEKNDSCRKSYCK
jgi:abortive infection bacteriophage resistance protein